MKKYISILALFLIACQSTESHEKVKVGANSHLPYALELCSEEHFDHQQLIPMASAKGCYMPVIDSATENSSCVWFKCHLRLTEPFPSNRPGLDPAMLNHGPRKN